MTTTDGLCRPSRCSRLPNAVTYRTVSNDMNIARSIPMLSTQTFARIYCLVVLFDTGSIDDFSCVLRLRCCVSIRAVHTNKQTYCEFHDSQLVKANSLNNRGLESLLQVAKAYKNVNSNKRTSVVTCVCTVHNSR